MDVQPITQVQVPTDIDLDFYYFKNIIVEASPTAFFSKNNGSMVDWSQWAFVYSYARL
jgi:hypothetical protein